ncbi:MAG: hypothetical protein C0518_09485 [Opitutus sp.]|nr:hypothetical protein [Opitutus sp.]
MNLRRLVLLATATVVVSAETTFAPPASGIAPVPPIEAPEIFLRSPHVPLKLTPFALTGSRIPTQPGRIFKIVGGPPGTPRLISRMPMIAGDPLNPWMPMLQMDPALDGKLLFAPIDLQPAIR